MCAVNQFLVATFLCCYFHLSGAAFLRCYKGSLDNYLVTPLEQPLAIWPCINTSLPTVFYTFGYRGRPSGPATTAVLDAYVKKKKRNLVLLDWEEEANSGLLGIPLGYVLHAVPNTKRIGISMGDALIQLNSVGLNMTQVHLMGHSLGAHVMAFAGKYARENGHVVSRITGLDPARPLFEGTFAVKSGLDRTCARFVDIVHSDPGGYGITSSAGTVDIWPNYRGEGSFQPGCPVGDFEMFTPEDLCKHDRSWRYYVEAISAPTSFPAVHASSYEDWVSSGGRPNETIYLGDLTNTRAKGNFYLRTNGQPPFGMGVQGLNPATNRSESHPVRSRRNSAIARLLRTFIL